MRPVLCVLLLAAVGARAEPVREVRLEGSALDVDLETRAGEPYSAALVRRDVERLWELGRFSDVRVRTETQADGRDVVFEVKPRRRYALREIRFEPPSEKQDLKGETPEWVDESTVREMARELAAGLRAKGYLEAGAHARLEPADAVMADIVVSVERGERTRIKQVEVTGLEPKQARRLSKELEQLRPRTVIPGLLRFSRALTPERLGSDVRLLRSALAAEGRLSPAIETRLQPSGKDGRVNLLFHVAPGPLFGAASAEMEGVDKRSLDISDRRFPAETLCAELRETRRLAESQGRVGFRAEVAAFPLGAAADDGTRTVRLVARTDASAPQTIRRIEFSGKSSLRNSTMRRALKLEEGDLLDESKLRRDLSRLSSISALEPLTLESVEMSPAGDGLVDLRFRVKGKGLRRWALSGPLGPTSLFGPFQAMIETRLPPWGRGLLEASTYAAGFWLAGVPEAVASAEGWTWRTAYRPAFVVRRLPLPGQALTSGWMWSPQTSLRGNLYSNAAMRSRGFLSKAMGGQAEEPPLPVLITGEGVNSELICRDPKSWTDSLRGVLRFVSGI